MKKLLILLTFFITPLFAFSNNSYGVKTAIGQNLIFADDTIKLPNYSIGIEVYNSDFPLTYFDVCYVGLFKKTVNVFAEPEIKESVGISGSVGYNFKFEPNENFLTITPCLVLSLLDITQNEYTSSNILQAGIKCAIGIGTNINPNLKVKLSFAPQYNFCNYIYEYKEKSKDFYEYDEEADKYNKTEFKYAESAKTVTAMSFKYDFGLSFIFTF